MNEQRPDLELRRKVAEAKGWTSLHRAGRHQLGGVPPFDFKGSYLTTPAYELYIAAAWKLLEGASAYQIDNLDGTCCCLIGTGVKSFEATGPTAPFAICRAYLAWKQATTPTGDTDEH